MQRPQLRTLLLLLRNPLLGLRMLLRMLPKWLLLRMTMRLLWRMSWRRMLKLLHSRPASSSGG